MKHPKPPQKRRAKPALKAHRVSKRHKESIRKFDDRGQDKSIVRRLKINLSQMVGSQSGDGKVEKYANVAKILSEIAGLKDGRVWSYNYIQSVTKGSVYPGKKFIQAIETYYKKTNPRQKKWFYFSRRRSVIAIYEKSIIVDCLQVILKDKGYKPVTYTRYMEVKRKAVK